MTSIIQRIILTVCFSVALMGFSLDSTAQDDSVFSDYLTPQMFGAKGDGKRDDTDALRKALYESSVQGKILYFPSGAKFKVTGTLNYYRGVYQDLKLNMLGCIPIKKGSYVPQEYGGISVVKGVKLFCQANISGSIERMCITGQRDLNVHFFDNCDCNGLVITGSNISNFGALFYDSKLHGVSQITQNTFLTLYYFARNDKTSSGMTDSTISFNYINGGMEQNDNSCFEWSYYNGDIISNNFIDYYRTIYYPKAVSKQAFVGPVSYSNQYQVFRYFYSAGQNISTITFSSSADSFNWNDPSTLEKLQKYKPETYKGKNGKTYEIPPYVACCNSTWNITVSDAKIERNMGALVFVASSLTEYEYNRFDVSFTGNNQYKKGQINYKQGDSKPFYNSGNYRQNTMKIAGIVEVLDELPQLGMGWSSSVQGRTVKVGETIYRASNHRSGNTWKAVWEQVTRNE
ncbi:MAG: hypothetical protein IKM89_04620 [Bacteroidales bacterium]|nr:hypothetical protein [Bacteroidales bacterium]